MLTWGDAMTDPPTTHRGFPSPIGFPGTLTQHEVGQDDRNLWLRKELGVFWSNFFFPWRFPAWKKKLAPRYFHSFVGIFRFRHLLYLLLLPLVHVRPCTSGGSAPSRHCGGSWLSKLFLPHVPRIRFSLKVVPKSVNKLAEATNFKVRFDALNGSHYDNVKW